jgi:aminomethyltransferase
MTGNPETRYTPLHALHLSLGAKMAPFGGFEMPIQYEGIFREHHATRTGATLFDTCHMGEFILQGPGALGTLETLVTCPLADLQAGACRYGLMCAEDGGTLDDLIVYREAAERFMIVVNAGTQDADFDWIAAHAGPGAHLENISGRLAKIDLQGPQSPAVLDALIPGAGSGLGYFRFRPALWRGREVTVSRTGYTGERGFEIYLPPEEAEPFWRDAMRHGAVPAGLGARDTLRLEAGLPLYGHELRRDRNAATAAMPRAIASGKPFIGASALRAPAARRQALAGLLLDGRQAARQGDTVLAASGDRVIGEITSGSFSPTLGTAIALAIVDTEASATGTALRIRTSRKTLAATVASLPFHTGSARNP